MAIQGAINTLITASAGPFLKEVKKAGGALGWLKQAAGNVLPALGKTALASGTAVAAGLTAITYSAMANADELGKQSVALDASVQSLSELQFACKLSDVEFSSLTSSLQKLNVKLMEAAATGEGDTADALDRLGLSAGQLSTLDAGQKIEAIATAMQKVIDPTEKAALRVALFGKGGHDLAGLLAQGGAGIRNLRKEAQEWGSSLKDIDAAQINAANDAFDRAGFAVQSLGQSIAIECSPYLVQLIEDFKELGFIGPESTGLISSSMESLSGWVKSLADWGQTLTNIFGVAQVYVKALGAAVTWLAGVMTGIPSLKEWGAGMGHEAKFAFDQLKEDWNAPARSQDITAWEQEVAAKRIAIREKAEADLANIGRRPKAYLADAEGKDKATAATDKLAKSQENLVAKLKEQVATFGMSADQIQLYKLAQEGASQATQQDAYWLQLRLARMKANQDAQDSLKDKAKSVLEDIATPQQKFNDKAKELFDLWNNRLLTSAQHDTALAKAKEDIFGKPDKKEEEKKKEETRFAALAGAGSAAAAQAIAQHMFGGANAKGPNKIENLATLQLRVSKKIEKNTANVVVLGKK